MLIGVLTFIVDSSTTSIFLQVIQNLSKYVQINSNVALFIYLSLQNTSHLFTLE